MDHLKTQLCIFVVDDNRDAAETMTVLLEMVGYRAHAFFDGSSALDAAAQLRPAAAILDIGMAGMDGYELAERLRTALPGTLLVACTAWGAAHDLARSKAAGFDFHLVKPVGMADIERVLDEIPAAASVDAR